MKVMIHCCLCDKEEEVEESEATDYICDECKEFYASLFSDAIHETAKMFRKDGDGEKSVEEMSTEEIEAFLREKEPFMFEWHDGGDDIY